MDEDLLWRAKKLMTVQKIVSTNAENDNNEQYAQVSTNRSAENDEGYPVSENKSISQGYNKQGEKYDDDESINSEDSNSDNGHVDNNDYDSRKQIWCEIFKIRQIYFTARTSKLSYTTCVNNMGTISLGHTSLKQRYDTGNRHHIHQIITIRDDNIMKFVVGKSELVRDTITNQNHESKTCCSFIDHPNWQIPRMVT